MRFFLLLFLFISMSFPVLSKEIVLTKDNMLVLDSAFTGESVAKVIEDARRLDADLPSGYPIYLFLNTPGGEIQAGLELIEFLKGVNRPVHTISLFAASMGWQLLQHLGTRYVLSYSVLMSHKARGGFKGEFGGGLSQLDARYSMWLKRIDMMDKQTVSRTNGKKTLEQYRREYDNELWLSGQEAVDSGYADEVVIVKCSKELSGTKQSSVEFFGMSIDVNVSECPIVTSPTGISASIRTNQGSMKLQDFLNAGGKFGKNCKKEEEKVVDHWNNRTEVIKSELCALDESLTLDVVKQKLSEVKQETTTRKVPIAMSFF